MNRITHLFALVATIVACQFTHAQAPATGAKSTTSAVQTSTPAASKPANATGQCRDGSYSTDASRSGACRGHHGVKEWYAAATSLPGTSAQPATDAAPATAGRPATTSVPAAPVSPSPTTQVRTQSQAAAQSAGQSTTPPATQSLAPPPTPAGPVAGTTPSKKGPKADLANTPIAPGGGPGMVWVNTASNVYHCPGTDFYGKTKQGSYMSETDAKAKGARANRGHACTQ